VAALPKPRGKKEWGFGNGDAMWTRVRGDSTGERSS
jgi:hypothetical protein